MANELNNLTKSINNAIRSDRNIRTALTTTLAIHKPRIFASGFDAKGAKIGTYSVNPISISKKNQARNTGKTYFKGGYAEYKRAVGKNPGFVNLRNTDQMYSDYGIIGNAGKYGFGFHNSKNHDKTEWMEDKYKKDIFDLSNNELNILADVLVDQIVKSLK